MKKPELLAEEIGRRVTKKINQREWWRTWVNKEALQERGLFLVSSFRYAEFYGRPLNNPFKVDLKNPLIGDEAFVMDFLGLSVPHEDMSGKEILEMEAKKMSAGIAKGFDSIVIISPNEFKKLKESGRLPNGYELQVFCSSAWNQLIRDPEGYEAKEAC